ncbi:MAG: hypothetical protein LC734_01135 [Acidobacteria bacterium]|nr:hypothetical protein [Acidobacteriota bacterium]
MSDYDVFEPFEKLIAITVLGRTERVPEKNSILRCLQFLDMEAVSNGDLCWNGDCLNCQVWVKDGDKEKALIACRTLAVENMEIVRLSRDIPYHFEK